MPPLYDIEVGYPRDSFEEFKGMPLDIPKSDTTSVFASQRYVSFWSIASYGK